MSEVAYLGLGSNLGDRMSYLEAGARALAADPEITVLNSSSVYESAPAGYMDQGNFLNAALSVQTTRSAQALLETMSRVEDHFGRQRTIRWGPRTLDLDLLLFGNRVIESRQLQLPHPRLMDRCFVLQPLVELNPELVHPQTGRTLSQCCVQLQCSEPVFQRGGLKFQ
jgi:2-amino-4-hydroxy-6-hydroxymethyldihydropteridine diphosphokinase